MKKIIVGKIICLLGLWLACPAAGLAQTQPVLFTQLHGFTNSPLDGVAPLKLILGQDNELYGVTYDGGTNGGGTIFRINRDGSGYAVLASFPKSVTGNSNSSAAFIAETSQKQYEAPVYGGLSLTPGGNGVLYGTTFYGGANNDGTVFEFNTQSNAFSTLHSFSAADGYPLNVMQGSDGALYGTTWNGGTNALGIIFKLAPDGSTYSVLYEFFPTNGFECTSLIQGSDGMLYGTLLWGSSETGDGADIFRIDTNGNNYVDLTNFPTDLPESHNPMTLIQGSDGFLYGTMLGDSVFQMNTNGSGFNLLHQFSGGSDEGFPVGLVQGQNGMLYGTTAGFGGSPAEGTVFEMNLGGSGYSVIYTFSATNGAYPLGGLAAGSFSGAGGVLYGTTTFGVPTTTNFYGNVFSLVVDPPLTITPVTSQSANGQTSVFWPAWAQYYILQSTTNLTSPNWANVTSGTQVVGVQVTNNAPATFYRLVYP